MPVKFKSPEDFRVSRGGEEALTWNDVQEKMTMDNLHLTLDGLGMVPGIGIGFDSINAILYLAQQKYGYAALSGVAMLPMIGQIATGKKAVSLAKATKEPTIKVFANSNNVPDTAELITKVNKTVVKQSDEIPNKVKLWRGQQQWYPGAQVMSPQRRIFAGRQGSSFSDEASKIKDNYFIGGRDLQGQKLSLETGPGTTGGTLQMSPAQARLGSYDFFTTTNPHLAKEFALDPTLYDESAAYAYRQFRKHIYYTGGRKSAKYMDDLDYQMAGRHYEGMRPVVLEFEMPITELHRLMKNQKAFTNEPDIFNFFGGGSGNINIIKEGVETTWIPTTIFKGGLDKKWLKNVHKYEAVTESGTKAVSRDEIYDFRKIFTKSEGGGIIGPTKQSQRLTSTFDDIIETYGRDKFRNSQWHKFMSEHKFEKGL